MMRKGKNQTQLASDFYKKYQRLWRTKQPEAVKPRETISTQSSTSSAVEKRQLDALMTMNDALCTAMESSAKRVKCRHMIFVYTVFFNQESPIDKIVIR